MAGIAIVLDLLRKNPNFSSSHALHTYGSFSAKVAASAFATATPFAYRALFGYGGIPVAHCDAGTTWKEEDYFAKIRSMSDNIFQRESLKEISTKEYHIELKPLFSAFGWKPLAITSLRSFLLYYLPLLEPRASLEEDDDEDFLPDTEEHRVDLVVPFKKSVKQIGRETAIVTTRRIFERLAVHYVSQRMAWKLLKDVPRSAMRKAQRGMPTLVYMYSIGKTTFRGHCLGVAAMWFVQVGIEIYRCFRTIVNSEEDVVNVDKAKHAKRLGKKLCSVSAKCGASLVFASIGAGIGATLFRPYIGQWIGCAVGDLAGPIIITYVLDKVNLDL